MRERVNALSAEENMTENGKGYIRRKALSVFILICLAAGMLSVNAAEVCATRVSAAAYVSIADFVIETVKVVGEKPLNKGQKVSKLAEKFSISRDAAAYAGKAIDMKLFKEGTFKNLSKPITLEAAVYLLVGADEYMNGVTFSKEDADYVKKQRISNISSVRTAYRTKFAKGYLMGLIAGTSNGAYSDSRTFHPKKKCTESECRRLLERFVNPEKRYKLSPDKQLCRTSEKNLPKLSAYYPYILDSYPNAYYDCMFNFMCNQARPDNAVQDPLWKTRDCGVYKSTMTWDETFSKLNYDDRKDKLTNYDSNNRLCTYCAFMYPSEYDRYALQRHEESGYLGMPLDYASKEAVAAKAREYAEKALNVDYRTLREDTGWQEYMLKNGIDAETLERYITAAEKDELVLECDITAADAGSMYMDRTPFTFKRSDAVVRVYAHYRIASDNGTEFPKGGLTVGSDICLQTLRNTRISDDGFMYVVDECFDWQDGYFDIGITGSGAINAAIFDVVRYKGKFIALFGYPCETPCYYPGTYTTTGVIEQFYKGKEQRYYEEWGYLY